MVVVGADGCCGSGWLLWERMVVVGADGCCGSGWLLWERMVAYAAESFDGWRNHWRNHLTVGE